MILADLKLLFKNKLLNIYPPEEINSFFTLCCEYYLKLDKIRIHSDQNYLLSEQQIHQITHVLNELEREVPIQYILGETSFYGLVLNVNKHVLIPRPETEFLVDIIIKKERFPNLRILDIGTGSGCIALTLANNLKLSLVTAIDISEEALEVAIENAKINMINNVQFIKDNILKPLKLQQKFDIIVSNPPYVCESEKKDMKKNVLLYEPHQALFVKDANPLRYYDAILRYAASGLKTHGRLYFEINENYGEQLMVLLKKYNYEDIELLIDLNGRNRYIHCEKEV